jgi:hypothetical protein
MSFLAGLPRHVQDSYREFSRQVYFCSYCGQIKKINCFVNCCVSPRLSLMSPAAAHFAHSGYIALGCREFLSSSIR